MSTAPSQRLEELFLRAVELPSAERGSFLDRACEGDTDLRAEVDALLQHHSGVGGFLDSKAAPGRGLLTQLGASALSEAEPLLPTDKKVGNFRVLGVLGSGGMGVVYVAQQDRPRRTVALKVMRRVLGDPNSASAQRILRRFEHEAELLGRLHHPGIAQIYEAGTYTSEGLTHPYIAMELVKGEPLLAYANKHNLGTREKLVLIERICEAVQHAHRNGVIHRDLKPANILVDESGRPKILDFGVARTTNSDLQLTSEHTAVGALIGTLPYMSPEQVSGDPAAVDTRSDVYAVGVILYELLTGKLPYDLTSRSLPEAARIIRDEEPTKLSTINRYFRGDVEMIVSKSLEKDRTRRYQSASDLGDDIARFLSGQAISARRDSAMYVLRKQLRRYRGIVSTAAFFLLVVICLGVFAAIQAFRASRLAATEILAKNDALVALKRAEIEKKRADETSATLSVQLARANVERGRLLGIAGNLLAAEDLIWPAHLREPNSRHTFFALWELYMHEPCLSTQKAHSKPAWGMTASRDGSIVVSQADGEPGFKVWETKSRKLLREIPAPATICRAMALNPAGTELAAGLEDGTIALFDVADGKSLASFKSGEQGVRGLEYSPDGNALLAGTGDGQILELDPRTLGVRRTIAQTKSPVARIAWSPDGKFFGSAHGDMTVRLWKWGSRVEPVRTYRGHTGVTHVIAFAPDSHTFATGGLDRTVRVWSTDSDECVAVLDAPNGTVRSLVFTSDGEKIVAGGWWTMNVWDWKNQAKIRSFSCPDTASGAAIVGNGDELWATVGDSIRVWDFSPTPGVVLLSGHTGRSVAAWSPDSKWIATGDGSGKIRLFDAETMKLSRVLSGGSGRVRALAFDAGSRYLVAAGEEHAARVFDLRSENPEPALLLQGAMALSPKSIAFSPDNSVVVLPYADNCHRVLSVPSFTEKEKIPTADHSEALSAQFSPDGKLLVTNDRGQALRLFEWPTLREVGTMKPGGSSPQPWSMDFTPDSQKLVLTSWNKRAEVWDVKTCRMISAFEGHGGLVTDVAVRLREPMIFATTSTDGTLKLWDMTHTNEPCMLTIDRFQNWEVNSLQWSPNGRKLIAGDSVGNVQVWNMRYFNRHMGGNMQYQLDRHRPSLPPDIPMEDILDEMRVLNDRTRTGA
ncbi:MAG: serine/threonine-protein kinase [Phycisphaerales bacterium]|nr:serine/threonine protein kinase [Planctomycetota bacterium]